MSHILDAGDSDDILMAKGWSIVKQVRMAGEGKCSRQRLIVGDFVGIYNGLFAGQMQGQICKVLNCKAILFLAMDLLGPLALLRRQVL